MPRRAHPGVLTGLRAALADEYREMMRPYWSIDQVMHEAYVERVLSGAPLRLHRYELDSVRLPTGSADDDFILTTDDELEPV